MDWLDVIPILCMVFPVSWFVQFLITRYCAKKDKRIDDIAEIKKMLEKHDIVLKKNTEEISKINERLDGVSTSMRSLLRQEIFIGVDRCEEAGIATVAERDALEDMYREYHALGGNGSATQAMERLKGLPSVYHADNTKEFE